MRRDYVADAFAHERSLKFSPRAWKLYELASEAMSGEQDPTKLRDLESLRFSVSLYIDHSQDITEAGDQNFRTRLQKIVQTTYLPVVCPDCQAGAPIFGAGEELPLFHQEESNGEIRWFDCPRSVASRAARR